MNYKQILKCIIDKILNLTCLYILNLILFNYIIWKLSVLIKNIKYSLIQLLSRI